MELILKENVIGLGYKDEIVTVKDGYGRNYLIPTGKAVIASASAKKMLAEELKQRAHKIAQIKKEAEELGFSNYPVCMAKTQYSLSDDMKALGRPQGFTLNVREVRISSGAGFIVALTGTIMTMPGLPKKPSAELIDIDNDGVIVGLF